MPISYILPRLIRHFLPGNIVQFLLQKRLIIRPGLETTAPAEAVSRYVETLSQVNISVQGKRVLVLGFGGRFALGCGLLDAGASQVLLVDPFTPLEHAANLALLPKYAEFLASEDGQVLPCSPRLQTFAKDIRTFAQEMDKVDLVLSSSVFEHLDDVEGITRALALCTHPMGKHLHYIDMRDHYFRFPFEMLTFSEKTWKNWLNPTSNLNRHRLKDYRRIFERYFGVVQIEIRESEPVAWEKACPRIRPEFLSGNPGEDSATILQVILQNPKA